MIQRRITLELAEPPIGDRLGTHHEMGIRTVDLDRISALLARDIFVGVAAAHETWQMRRRDVLCIRADTQHTAMLGSIPHCRWRYQCRGTKNNCRHIASYRDGVSLSKFTLIRRDCVVCGIDGTGPAGACFTPEGHSVPHPVSRQAFSRVDPITPSSWPCRPCG